MPQLKDDCFAFGGALMTLHDALSDINKRIDVVTDTETVAINQVLGRILAENIVSPLNVPPHNNSAVDGYAVRFEDLTRDGPSRLPVFARIAAGHPLAGPVPVGSAVEIFTGAPMPAGIDTVFMKEDCDIDVAGDAGDVILPPGLKFGSNARQLGEDIKQGAVILEQGQRLRPQDIGLAASIGRAEILVYKRLKVAVFSSGDEVYDPSDDVPSGGIYDANRYVLMSLLNGLDVEVDDLGILQDDQETITSALKKAAKNHDLIMTSGGVSVGEEDHIKSAVDNLGAIDFWRLAIRPGRPIALGQVMGKAFVGLPGNPVAAMVTFLNIARSVIACLNGENYSKPPLYNVRAGFEYKKKRGRREWLRTLISTADDGTIVAIKYPSDGAGVLTSLVVADGLIELPEDLDQVNQGDMVEFIPFKGILS